MSVNTVGKLSIIGCGNPNRSDDGVGPYVISLLRDSHRPAPGVSLFDAGTAGIEVMFQARGSSRLIIVDACQSDHDPGAVFKVPGESLQRSFDHQANLHSFRWQHALYAGRRIFGDTFPSAIDVWLIEAESLALGLELSAPVRAAARQLAATLQETIAGHVGNATQAGVA